MMNQGVALQIAEIRPNTNIEQEIFPRELDSAANNKDIFTPPNHKQMRFMGGLESKPSSSQDNEQFFITENIEIGAQERIIKEERSQESEVEEAPGEEEEENDYEEEDIGNDENFDFGRAKQDYFKTRAREILMNEQELEYEGNPLLLNICYKQLKNQLKNPVVVHNLGDTKPHYLKMTFAMLRNAANGDKFLELSKL